MNFDVSGINWLAVAAADVAGFLLGAVIYGGLFTKTWVDAYGFTEAELEAAKGKTARNFMVYLVAGFVVCLAMAILFRNLNLTAEMSAMTGLQIGAFVGIGFVAMVLWMQVMSGNYKPAALLVDGAYYVIWFVLAGAILGMWK